jgi:hypothetical protein
MDKIFMALMLAPWVYAIGLIMYFIILYNQKKKLPVRWVVADLIFVGTYLYFHNLMYEKELVLIGSYKPLQNEYDLATADANMETLCINVGAGIVVFALLQFLFMKYINKQISKLNDPPPVEYYKKGNYQ